MTAAPIMRVAAALQKRGIQRLAYFHTDHFEPWRNVPGRAPGLQHAIPDVESYIRTLETIDYARRSTLFLKSNVNFAVDDDRDLFRAKAEDRLGFVPRAEADRAIGRAIMAPLAASWAEIQLHIHHENFTWNGKLGDATTREYLLTPLGKALGPARLELAIRLNLALIEEDGGPRLRNWFFVHGHWALNASDPGECTIVREIELLMRNGCLGDFSQPAGRPRVDSHLGSPHLVHPVAAAKGYATPAAQPVAAAGARGLAADRFFIWATDLDHRLCSIDTYSTMVTKRAARTGAFGMAHAERGVVLGDTLYVKTHSHSMAPAYWGADGRPFPHADEAVKAELNLLFDAACMAGADVLFLTASEVYDEFLDSRETQRLRPRLQAGTSIKPPIAEIIFRDESGAIVPPPPLDGRPPSIELPCLYSPAPDDHDPGHLPYLRMPGEKAEPAMGPPLACPADHVSAEGSDTGDKQHRRLGSYLPRVAAKQSGAALKKRLIGVTSAALDQLVFPFTGVARMARRERRRESQRRRILETAIALNALASTVVARRLAGDTEEKKGLTGYYVTRSADRSLLQPSEIELALHVMERFGPDLAACEVGCGLGLLTMLINDAGGHAFGVDRNMGRIAAGRAIARDARRAGLRVGAPSRLIPGTFPQVVSRRRLTRHVALVTNLLGSASIEEQRRFILGLRDFEHVVVDLQRFFVRRVADRDIAELVDMFRQSGFSEPETVMSCGADGQFALFRPLATTAAARAA